MAGCKFPTGIAYVAGHRLVTACGAGGAKILDAATGKEIASFKTGGFPDAVIYDPVRRLAMIPSALDGKLTVISLSGPTDNTVIATIPTQLGARLGAVDPRTGRVYLPTAEYNAAAAGKRPTPKPGTFQILVLDRQ
jgi:DNA-binding beta-propeller fold protein YncE